MVSIAANRTSGGGHGIGRVVSIVVGSLTTLRREREHAIARCSVGTPARMQEVFRLLCARRRPGVFIPPCILAHDEDAHRLATGEAVPLSEKEIVIPIESGGIFVILGRGASEINVTDFSANAGMASNGDKEPLSCASLSITRVIAQANVIAQRATLKDVVPGRDGKSRNLYRAELLLNGPLLPVVVIGWMREPV